MPNISTETRDSIIVALSTIYVDTQSFDDFLISLNKIRNTIVNNGTHVHQVTSVIRDAESKNWLLKLLFKAHELNKDEEGKGHPLIQTALANLVAEAGAKSGDFYDVCFVRSKKHFLLRDGLRTAVRELAGSQANQVLRVNGNPKSGRTFSYEFINHIYRDSLDCVRVKIDLSAYVAKDFPTYELVKDIALELPWLDRANIPEARSDDIGAWFVGQVRAAVHDGKIKFLWLILDECDAVGLEDNGINTFIGLVAHKIASVPNFRLVLLAKADSVPNEDVEEIAEPSSSQITSIVETHLKKFLEWKEIIFEDDDLKAHAQEVVSLISGPFFPGVNKALRAWESSPLYEELHG